MPRIEPERLASFLSASHRSLLGAFDPSSTDPVVSTGWGAILFVDISGFTTLTERLANRGALGVEELSELINGCFSRLTDLVTKGGGDLLVFVGDAAISLWPAHREEDLPFATCSAAAAGLRIQQELRDFEPAPGFRLRLRASVGAGTTTRLLLGGIASRRQFLLAGECIREAVRADAFARTGEVTATPRTWRLLQPFCTGRQHNENAVLLESTHPPHRDMLPDPDLLEPIPTAKLLDHLPTPVADRLATGRARWLAEFRNLTVLFIGLTHLDPGALSDLPRAQRAVCTIQEILEQFGGSVYQLVADDKGTTLVAAFGLPPITHLDDTPRSVKAALAIAARLGEHAMTPSIGLATGQVFCGVYGNRTRRQYTLVGTTIILAARLMQAAEGQTLVAPETVEGCRNAPEVGFESSGSSPLKGFSEPVELFRPLLLSNRPTPHLPTRSLIGRQPEKETLDRALASFPAEDSTVLITCEGESGIGKSELVAHFRIKAQARKVRCLLGSADEIQRGVSYFAWRTIFQQGLELDPDASLETRRRSLLEALSEDQRPYAPLLNAVLPLELPETATTAELAAEVRAENRHRLMAKLIDRLAREHPTLLILEDVHWLDAASMTLLERVVHSATPILIVATILTGGEVTPKTWGQELRPRDRLLLRALSDDEAEELILRTLDDPEAGPEVVAAIRQRAAGHPLFTTELALAWRETGQPLGEGDVSSTIQGAVTSRIDALPADHQILFKVASVFGPSFDLEILAEVMPADLSPSRRQEICDELESLELLRSTGSTGSFRFRAGILQEVAYSSLAFAQRRELHGAIAQRLEKRHRENLSYFFALLAHHWRQAQDIDRAVDYLQRAGALALDRYDNEGAVGFFEETIALDARPPESIHRSERQRASAESRGRWHLGLGRAYVNWSKYAPGRKHLESGLALWGLAMPTTPGAGGLELLRQIWRQIRFRRRPPAPAPEPERLLACARAHESLMEIYYVSGADLECLVTILRSLNLAEQAGPSAELARAYAMMGSSLATIMGQLPLAKLSDDYYQRALGTARSVGDPSASAWVSMVIGMSILGIGRHQEKAECLLHQAEDISRRLGDHRRLDDTTQNLATLSLIKGDLEACARHGETLYRSARERRDRLCQAEALRRKALFFLFTNDLQTLPEILIELREIRVSMARSTEIPRNPDATALEALFRLYQGNLEAAVILAEEGLELFSKFMSFYDLFFEWSALSRVFLTAWESSMEGSSVHQANARRAVDGLWAHARLFPIAAPIAGLHRGLFQWLDGDAAKAEASWDRALVLAREVHFPIAEGLLEMEMGRRLRPESPASRERVARGRTLFENVGAWHPLLESESAYTLP